MTIIGECRAQYAVTHHDTDPRPSRFTPEYAAWCKRADRSAS